MPRLGLHPVLIATAALLLALPLAAQQQNSPPAQQTGSAPAQQPASASSQPKKQNKKDQQGKKVQKDKKDQKAQSDRKSSPPQQNPFPLAESEKAAHHAQQQNAPSAPASSEPAPSAPAPQQGSSTADRNPFPLAESEKAQQKAEQRQNAAQNAAQSNQDSSSSVVKGLNLPTQAGPQPGPGIAPVLNPSLGRKDTRVGDFYLQSGDWKGAYDRFLQATQVDPGDAEAVFGLAESARQLGYRNVAIQNYELYLSAIPYGHHAKACRKALKEMGAQP
jgi:hypothetical protein